MTIDISRRSFVKTLALGAGAVAGTGLFPSASRAAGELVAATYPGAFEESHRKILLPAARRATGGEIVLTPVLGSEQVAKTAAASSHPPYDVLLLDEGPMLEAIPRGLFAPFPVEKAPHDAELGAPFRSRGFGPTVTVQLIGIAYNPKKITTPPTSWLDLWKPEYKGRVGIPHMESSLGTTFMVEVAKLKGGSEKNLAPAFAALEDLLPNVGAVAPNPGAVGTLFQQGQIDIAPFYFNNTKLIAAKDVDVAFVRPESGLVLVRTSMHVAKNTEMLDRAIAYVDAALAADVQEKLQAAPYYLVPTNAKTPFSAEIAEVVGGGADALLKNAIPDWATINASRGDWLKEFATVVRS
ncbi:MAG: extracellular solute-binding protein [Phyllobacteriaceae bacterium]|nr:extracellular solute-binding protein [Phyllobacteriaceae bacterium]